MSLVKQSSVKINFSSWEAFTKSVHEWFVVMHNDIVNGKHFVGLVTIFFTAAVIPLFRLIAQDRATYRSKAADAGVWVLMNIFGIGIIVYPWWLATAKSPLYYSRLQFFGRVVSAIILILAGVQGIFNPERPFEKNNPSQTTLTFKIISTLDFVSIFIGLLVALPIFIRRDRLFKSQSKSLFRFAWLFTAIMLAGLIVRRWTGFSRIVSFSCLFLVVQFFVLNYVEDVERRAAGKTGIFDEAYIIIAGFVPYWLASTVGSTLLEIVSQSGAVGTVFVYFAWRMVIYALEYMASEVGRKASRFSDGSVFSFSAIYTGATYANFIFLSVQFNSGTFWALLLVTVANIIVVQGGIMIDIDYLFMDYIAVGPNWPSLFALKVWYFEFFRNMPHEIAVKVANCRDNPTPEIQLALIRGRATVLQINWVHNDIKMSSEFQALACAGTAVAMEIALTYLPVGSDSITANLSDRRGVLYIYCVNILFSMFAQSIARRRLQHKVSKLKKEISATVKALEHTAHPSSSAMRRSSTGSVGSVASEGGAGGGGGHRASRSRAGSSDSATDMRASAMRKKRTVKLQRSSTTPFSAMVARFMRQATSNFSAGAGSAPPTTAADIEAGAPIEHPLGTDGDDGTSSESDDGGAAQLISERDVDADALNAILGLCQLYATEDMLAIEENERAAKARSVRSPAGSSPSAVTQNRPFAAAGSGAEQGSPDGKGGSRFGKIRFVRGRSSVGATAKSEDEASDDDGWEEVELTTRDSTHFRASLNAKNNTLTQRMSEMLGDAAAAATGTRRGTAPLSNVVRMQGYLQKRKPGTTNEYQRRFFILTDLQLMYFESEEDVTQHINRRKGAVKVADITNVDRYDPNSLCIINVAVRGRVYAMMAADRGLADEWYDMLQDVRDKYKAAMKRGKGTTPGGGANAEGGKGDAEEEHDNARQSQVGGFQLPWFTGSGGDGPQARSGLGNLTSALGLSSATADGEEADAQPVSMVEMLRRGTTNVRRGIGSVYYGAASSAYGRLPSVAGLGAAAGGNPDLSEAALAARGPRHGSMRPLTPQGTTPANEVWKHGWDVSHLPRKMGYLQKKGDISPTWKQRWFVLDTAGNISWYEKAGQQRNQLPKGCVSLGEVVVVNDKHPNEPRLIEFRHIAGRIYQLEAASELDADDWRRALSQWVESARNAIDNYNRRHKDPFIVGVNHSSGTYDQDRDEEEQLAASAAGTEKASTATDVGEDDPRAPPRKMAGYLLKRGGFNAAFKRRWLVLDAPGVLTWYEKPSHEFKPDKAKGSMNLADVMCVKEPREDAPNLLEIRHVQGRTYEMEATTTMEANEWRAEINKWLRVAHENVKKTTAALRHSAEAPEGFTPLPTGGNTTSADAATAAGEQQTATATATAGGDRESVSEKAANAFGRLTNMFSTQSSSRKYELFGSTASTATAAATTTAGQAADAPVEGEPAEEEIRETATNFVEALTRARDSAAFAAARRAGQSASQSTTDGPGAGAAAEEEKKTETDTELPIKSQASTRRVVWGAPPPPEPRESDQEAGTDRADEEGEEKSADADGDEPSYPGTPPETDEEATVTYDIYDHSGKQDPVGAVPMMSSPISKVSKRGPSAADGAPAAPKPITTGITATLTRQPPKPLNISPLASQRAARRGSTTYTPARATKSASPPPQYSRASPSFSKLSASIAGRDVATPDSAEEDLPRPEGVVVPTARKGRPTMRRQSSVERALEARRRGFTSVTPTSVTQLRKAAKRNNILATDVTMLKNTDKSDSRRDSDLADTKFLNRMAKRHSSELVDNLQKKSYQDMNAEFWVKHKWYLSFVVCFVTLNVLYTTAYIVSIDDN